MRSIAFFAIAALVTIGAASTRLSHKPTVNSVNVPTTPQGTDPTGWPVPPYGKTVCSGN